MSFRGVMVGLVSAGILTLSGSVNADVLGVTAGISGWYSQSSGTLQSGGNPLNIENDLNFSDETLLNVYVSLEHPIPLLPNVKFKYFDSDQVAYGHANTTFKGVDFNGGVTTSLDFSQYDFILYYEVLDNIVSLDVGLNAKLFDGNLAMRQQNDATKVMKEGITEVLPMLYGNAEVAIPFMSSVSFGLEGSAMALGDNTAYDVSAKVKLRIVFAGLELGYRQISAQLDDVEGIAVDVDHSGPYVSAGLVF